VSVACFFLIPGIAAAQTSRCGDWDGADARLEHLSRYFIDPEYKDFREDLIEQVSADAPRYVVRDTAVCEAIMDSLLAQLHADPNWADTFQTQYQNGWTYNVLRYGPYYAVVALELPPPGKRLAGGWAKMWILRASDLKYIGGGLV
jgi:hypothetical protein